MKNFCKKIIEFKLAPFRVFTIGCVSFIIGVLVAPALSIDWQYLWPALGLLLSLLLLSGFINLLLGTRVLVLLSWLSIFFLLGLGFYVQKSEVFCQFDISSQEASLEGTIVSNPVRSPQDQQVIISSTIGACKNVRILVKLPHFPEYRYGQIVSLQGKLQKPGMIEDFDYEKYLRPKLVGYLLMSPQNIEVQGEARGVKFKAFSLLYNIKNLFERAITQSLPEPEASLGAGIMTGTKASISEQLQNDLNTVGLTHIIALSGFNITIIISALALLLSGYVSRRTVFVAGALLSLLFIVMTGASASVVRAGIFSLLILYSRTIGRKSYQTNILLLTAVVMLAINPFLLKDDLGFQLSFLAFSGLIYLSAPLTEYFKRTRLSGLPDFIKLPLIETLSAQIAVFPLIAFVFGRISVISPLTNVLVLWLIPVAMLLVFLCGISGMIFLPLARLLGLLAWPVLAYVIKIAELTSKIPLASINTPKYSIILVSTFYLIILTALMVYQRKKLKFKRRKLGA